MFDFIVVGLNLDIEFFITVEPLFLNTSTQRTPPFSWAADSEVEENILFSLFVDYGKPKDILYSGDTSLCSEDVPEYIQVQELHTLPVNSTKNRLDHL